MREENEAKLEPMPEVAAVHCGNDSLSVTVVHTARTRLIPPRQCATLDEIGQTPDSFVSRDGIFTLLP